MPFVFKKLSIPDIIRITPKTFKDDRGFFLESFKRSDFEKNGIEGDFLQDNYSVSAKNVIRGLHFQRNPMAQGKLVRVTKGVAWDVAVDLREGSSTYLKWIAVELNDVSHDIVWIPPGFAHGFAALTEEVHLQYKCTREYSPELDSGIRFDDDSIGIPWPIDAPLTSVKDTTLPSVEDLTEQGLLPL